MTWTLLWWLVCIPAAYFLYALVYAIYSRPPSGTWSFEESFESGDLRAFGRLGVRQLARDHSAEIVDSPVRDGRHALRMHLKATDPFVRGNRRAELRMRSTRLHTLNDYAFSVRVPADWQEDPHVTIVAQWHSVPDRWRGEAYLPSPLLLCIRGARWQLIGQWDARPVVSPLFRQDQPEGRAELLDLPVEKDRWVDWSFRVRWAFDDTGLLQVMKDGIEVLHRVGPNAYNDAIGPYFKFGLYWFSTDGSTPVGTRTIYFDAIRVVQGR